MTADKICIKEIEHVIPSEVQVAKSGNRTKISRFDSEYVTLKKANRKKMIHLKCRVEGELYRYPGLPERQTAGSFEVTSGPFCLLLHRMDEDRFDCFFKWKI